MTDTVERQAGIVEADSPSAAPMRVAYLVNQYPKISHAFIRREIAALESVGACIERFSLRPCKDQLVEEADRAELARTRNVLQLGMARLVASLIGVAIMRPFRFAQALSTTLQIGRRSDRGMLRNLGYLAEASVLLGWFHEKGVQHVHAHFATNPAAVAMLCHRLGGPSYSFTAHGPDDFDRATCLSLEQKIAGARFVLSVSSFGRSQLYRWCDPLHWSRIGVLHPGIDETLLLHPAAPIPAARKIVCVGRLHPDKGQLLLIEAVGQLVAQGIPCELVLVGDGEMRAGLAARIAGLGLQTHVTLAGAVSSAELYRHIQSARVLVVPSLAENLPSVILEAFVLGRPVIASAIAGIPELVEPHVSGWLVPASSVDALAAAIRQALEAGTDELERMGREGRKRVIERYRSRAAAARLVDLFRTGEF